MWLKVQSNTQEFLFLRQNYIQGFKQKKYSENKNEYCMKIRTALTVRKKILQKML